MVPLVVQMYVCVRLDFTNLVQRLAYVCGSCILLKINSLFWEFQWTAF